MNGQADGPVPFHYPHRTFGSTYWRSGIVAMQLLLDMGLSLRNFVANVGAVALFFLRILSQYPRH